MSFIDLINRKYSELQEQVPGEVVPPATPVDAPAAPVDVQPPAEETKPLTAEGEVFLVRLLRKALFMNPGEMDEKLLKDLPDTNENNATDVLNSIIEIMKKYSNSIDINTEPTQDNNK